MSASAWRVTLAIALGAAVLATSQKAPAQSKTPNQTTATQSATGTGTGAGGTGSATATGDQTNQTGEVDEATRTAARELAREGLELMQNEEWAEALKHLERAYKLVPAPTVALLEARTHAQLDQLVEAVEAYERARVTTHTEDPPVAWEQAKADATIELDALRPRVPRLAIFVGNLSEETGVPVVLLDGTPVPEALLGIPRMVNPGAHVVELRIDDKVRARRDVEVVPFGKKQIVLRPTPLKKPPPPPPPEPPLGDAHYPLAYVALSLGGAGVALGIVTGILADDTLAGLDEKCPDGFCPPSQHDELDKFRTLRTTSTIGYISGAAFTAIGGALLISGILTEAGPAVSSGQNGAGVQASVSVCSTPAGGASLCAFGTF